MFKPEDKRVCFCGCDEFHVCQNAGDPWRDRYFLVCAGCGCRRRITTPGVGARSYSVIPAFGNDPEEKANA